MLGAALILLLAAPPGLPAAPGAGPAASPAGAAAGVPSLLDEGLRQVRSGQAEAAESTLTHAADLARRAGDGASERRALRGLAEAMTQREENPAPVLKRLLERARAAGDREHEGWAEAGLAERALQRDELPAARRGFETAHAHFLAAGSTPGLARADLGLGRVAWFGGDGPEAARRFAVAESLARASDDAIMLGRVLNAAGSRIFFEDPAAAIRRWRGSVDAFERGEDQFGVLTPLFNLAMAATHAGDLADAASALERIVRLSETHGYRANLRDALTQLGIVRRLQGDLDASSTLLDRAIRLRAGSSEDRLFAVQQAALTLLAMKRPADALERIRRGLADEPAPPPARVRRRLSAVEADALRALGRPREALALYLEGTDLRTPPASPVASFLLMVPAAECYRALGRPDSAGFALDRAIAAWESLRVVPSNREWRVQRGAVARRLYSNLLALRLASPDTVPPGVRARRAFDSAQRFKTRVMLEEMRGPEGGPRAAEDGMLATASQLQREVLHPDEAFLDFFVGPAESWVFAITRDTLMVRSLPGRDSLRRVVGNYLSYAAAPHRGVRSRADRELAANAGRGLSRMLLGDLLDQLPRGTALLYAPDDELHALPIGALPGPGGGGPLLAGRLVCAVPSASALAAIRARARPAPPRARLAVIAGESGDDRLRGAAREIRWLLRRYRDTDIVESDADWEARLAGEDVLHFAGHVEGDPAKPWSVGLSLGAGGPADGESLLTVARIADLDLGARLCVLSGCGTARGMIYAGEGSMHAASAFVEAGASTVVATLWRVEDEVTERIMTRFYLGLDLGLPAGEALRRAQLEVRRSPATAHPFQWAGFVLIGDPATTVRLAPRSTTQSLSLALLPVLAGLVMTVWIASGVFSRRRAVTGSSGGTT